MNTNNNFTPLAWHEGNVELQSHRASYAFGHVVPLLASSTTFLPFQIVTATGAITLTNDNTCDIRLRKLDGTDAVGSNLHSRFGLVKKSVTIREADTELGITAVTVDVIIYNGGTMTALPTGQYYLTLTSNSTTWYSDVVTIVSDTTKLTKLVWWDEKDLVFGEGCIVYKYGTNNSTQYKNTMYLLEELGMPEYTVEEEGDNRDGLFYASKLISGKKYKIQVAQLTEAMCDALRFVHLSDRVEVYDGYSRHYQCDSVLVTPSWQSGAVASAAVELTTNTFVKQLGTGYITDQLVTGVIGESVIGSSFVIGG